MKQELTEKELWNRKVKKNMRSYRMWQFLAITCMVYSCGVTTCSLQNASEPKLQPYVVQVNENGDYKFKGIIGGEKPTLNDAIIKSYINRFLTDVRSVSSDLVVLKTNLKDAYYIANSAMQTQITEQINNDKPIERSLAGGRIDVRILLYQVINPGRWRVEWEEVFRTKGSITDTIKRAGTLSFIQVPPDKMEAAEKNPFGLYFTEFYMADSK